MYYNNSYNLGGTGDTTLKMMFFLIPLVSIVRIVFLISFSAGLEIRN